MIKAAIFASKKNSTYSGYPGVDTPSRIDQIRQEVEATFGNVVIVPLDRNEAISEILKVHSKEHLQRILEFSRARVDKKDVTFEPGLPDVAFNAINTAIKATEEGGFAVIRPPGHHAGKDSFEGFCYFNNAVISVLWFLEQGERVALLDLDAHYGDGTHSLLARFQNAFYASIHADTAKYYPHREISTKKSCIINVEPKNETDERFLHHLDQLISAARRFHPTVVCISIGFDTYYRDPVQGFAIRDLKTYRKIGRKLKRIAPIRTAILEGGYHDALGSAAVEFYSGWSESD